AGQVRRESPILPPGYQRPQVQPQSQAQPLQQTVSAPVAGQWNAQYQQPPQQVTHIATPPPPPQQSVSAHMSPAAQYYSRPPSRPQSSPLTQTALQPHMNAAAAAENVPLVAPAAVQNFSQSYSKPVKSFYSDTYHAVGVVGRKGGVGVAAPVPAAVNGVLVAQGGPVLGVLPPQQAVVDRKSNSFTGAPVAVETKIPDTTGAMDGVQVGEIPEIDTDSAGMMETLMRNLQRAARQGQV
ncbi:hypothetical protein V501_06481, partial [Pseudogymnoascus sp. VKM F-4519 (FW-2642)]